MLLAVPAVVEQVDVADERLREVDAFPVDERADDKVDAVEGDGGVGGARVVEDRRAEVKGRANGLLKHRYYCLQCFVLVCFLG